MELKELKCVNCGASLEVEKDAKEVKCKFCNTTFSVETAENKAYEEEKGRIKAQQEEMNKQLENTKGKRIVFYIIFIVVSVLVVFIFATIFINANKQMSNMKNVQIEARDDKLKSHIGTTNVIFVKSSLQDIITNNRKTKYPITVVYNSRETNNPNEIKELKDSLNKNEYDIDYEYDDNMYINKMIIEDI